jgi:glutamate formiminotransferase/formiminotetrahydrofolate cyclodeaminase
MSDAQSISEQSVARFTERLATRDPVPGGGSAAAVAGSIAAALVAMVVELSLGRPELAAHEPELRRIGEAAAARRRSLVDLAERDAAAYGAVIAARRLGRATDAERSSRRAAIAAATRDATKVPLETAESAAAVLELAAQVAPLGNPNAVSDAGVAAHLAAAAIRGALLNVRINLPYLADDDPLRSDAAARAEKMSAAAGRLEGVAREAVEARIG